MDANLKSPHDSFMLWLTQNNRWDDTEELLHGATDDDDCALGFAPTGLNPDESNHNVRKPHRLPSSGARCEGHFKVAELINEQSTVRRILHPWGAGEKNQVAVVAKIYGNELAVPPDLRLTSSLDGHPDNLALTARARRMRVAQSCLARSKFIIKRRDHLRHPARIPLSDFRSTEFLNDWSIDQ